MLRLNLYILTLSVATAACTSVPEDTRLRLAGQGKKLSYSELAGYTNAKTKSVSRSRYSPSGERISYFASATPLPTLAKAPAVESPESSDEDEKATCTTESIKQLKAYQHLASQLTTNQQQRVEPSVLATLKLPYASACSEERASETLKALAKVQKGIPGRVGVLLPLTATRAKLATNIVEGLRAAFKDAGAPMEQNVALKDSSGGNKVVERLYAELLLIDKAVIIVGGLEKAEAETLSRLSRETSTPTLLLNRERALVHNSPLTYRVYPDEVRLADALAEAAKQRKFTKLAILKPASGKSDELAKLFAAAVKAKGGQIIRELVYTTGNYDSMSQTTKMLFRTDPSERREEFQKAYKDAKKKAEAEKVPFDPRMVLLPPIIDFDAVFLPDDFRTARHFAKLIKYQQVEKMPMIGNHEWRSPALIEPWDDFLEGGIFADFVGSYADVPASIAAPVLGSPYFISPQAVVATDFRLIGYRAGRIAGMISKRRAETRPAVAAMLAEESVPAKDGSSKKPLFGQDRINLWPTYVFSVIKNGVKLDLQR